jgi:uncharacterized protein
MNIQLQLLPNHLAVARLDPESEIPAWVHAHKSFLSITYTHDELSIVCDSQLVPANVQCEPDWRAFKIVGPLDFSLVGILSPIATLLAQQAIPIFVLSTFDTDYILIKSNFIDQAKETLQQANYLFI